MPRAQKMTRFGTNPIHNTRQGYLAAQKRKRGRRTMKRTTKRGAYRRGNKNAMMIRRAPFIETKSRTSEDVRVDFPSELDHLDYRINDTEHVHMNPTTFLLQKQGLGEHQMIGKSIYGKYLKMKVSVRFAQPFFTANGVNRVIPQMPQRTELIWGWVPNPLNLTSHTDPTADACTISDINSHINHRVVDYLNQQKDKLRYISKASSTLQIIGRRKVRPDLRYNGSNAPTTLDVASTGIDKGIGSIPDFDTSIYWPLKKKIHYEFSDNLTTNASGFFPNYEEKLPFCVLVNWDYIDLQDGKENLSVPAVAYNDAIWYSDS